MADSDHKPLDECQSSEDPLVGILAAMVRSALEWEAENHLRSSADSNPTHDAMGVDYAPTDPGRFLKSDM